MKALLKPILLGAVSEAGSLGLLMGFGSVGPCGPSNLLGALFFVMLQHLTGAAWSVTMRRMAENVMAAIVRVIQPV